MKKHNRLGIPARIWSPYLKDRMGFSAKRNKSVFTLLCIALRGDGLPKPAGCSDKAWCIQNVHHIENEFSKLRGVHGAVKPVDQVPRAKPTVYVGDVSTDAFLSSYEWRRVRMLALKRHGAICQCCGARPPDAIMNVDHIKPRKIYPQLALDVDNLQILCHECNHGKGNWDMTDWRHMQSIQQE